MRKVFQWRSWFAGAAMALLATQAFADPVLPYAAPVAEKLSNDVAALEAIPDRTPAENQELKRDNSALNAYRRTSTKFTTDISVLRSLYQLLASDPDYALPLNDAISGYFNDFVGREAALRRTTDISPRSNVRTNAYHQLNKLSNNLWRAEQARPPLKAITHLGAAARRLPAASNAVHRASVARVRASSAAARIGKLTFISPPGSSIGTNTNGVLDFHSQDLGILRREISFHLEGVTEETPATYELGVGANKATYYVKDAVHPLHGLPYEAYFDAIPGPETNRSVVIIDAINTNYIVGRFRFTGFTTNELTKVDTNQITTITNGEFQITL
jgi:hypothetical protein